MGAEEVAGEPDGVAARTSRSRPLAFKFEIYVVEVQKDRVQAEALALQQASVMRDVPAWVAQRSGRAVVQGRAREMRRARHPQKPILSLRRTTNFCEQDV